MITLQQKKNNSNKVIFLFGPTAVGKTDLLCSLFSSGYEVVNADSVQVYKGLDVGSAKADLDTQKKVPHHLIDILEPWETYNVASFITLADKACEEIRSRGNIPVISGGTAYYFKHFLYGLSEAPQADINIRKEVQGYIEEVGLQKAHEYLCSIDPEAGQRINPNDGYRISRAIEVYKTSGFPLSHFKVPDTIRNNMEVLSIGLVRDKSELDERIKKRVDIMFQQGLVNEIKNLMTAGANLNWQGMQGIGYKEFLTALEGNPNFDELNLEEIKNEIVMNSVHYAKRQMTFFKSFANVQWVNPEDFQAIQNLLSRFC